MVALWLVVSALVTFVDPQRAVVDQGLPMGTLLAFMMAVVALSLPELILLRRVLKPQLLAIYVAVVGSSIVAVGYLFNYLLA